MGQGADDAFDHMLDEWEDNYEGYDDYGGSSQVKTCRLCGESWLHWMIHEGRWRLFDNNNKLHVCNLISDYRKKFG